MFYNKVCLSNFKKIEKHKERKDATVYILLYKDNTTRRSTLDIKSVCDNRMKMNFETVLSLTYASTVPLSNYSFCKINVPL